MDYELIKLHSEAEYRSLFEATYCNPMTPVLTIDDIWVRFFPDMFDHAFFESASRIKKDKSVFCHARAERIFWIKNALQDPNSIKKVGWNKDENRYDDSRRVALVQENFVVIIGFVAVEKARFITAYVADLQTINKILQGPDWTKK